MELTEEKAIAYFNEKAPKALREKEINIITELEHYKGGKVYIINNNYAVYIMTPEPMNCLMRNQDFTPRISGRKLTKQEVKRFLESEFYKVTCNRIIA